MPDQRQPTTEAGDGTSTRIDGEYGPRRVVIVGGNAGGMSVATRLRRLDEAVEIVVLERGQTVSYASCGLPYHLSGTVSEESLTVHKPGDLAAMFDLDVRTGHEAVDVDTDAKTVTVRADGDRRRLAYDDLVLAPGAGPVVPPIDGIESVDAARTLRTVADARTLRERVTDAETTRALVVGGGYIGLEAAENLDAAGLDVTVVELLDRVMATTLDPAMAALVQNHLRDYGPELVLETGVTALEEHDDAVTATLDDGSTVETDLVVLATGVRPRTDIAERAGIALGDAGGIAVDDRLQTSASDVYAVGDAAEVPGRVGGSAWVPLGGPANRAGRVAANVIAGRDDRLAPVLDTAVAKVGDLTVGTVGRTASALAEADRPFEQIHTRSPSHATYYPDADRLWLTLLFDPDDGTLLGAQAVGGDGVDKRIDVLATALDHGDTVFDLQQLDLAYAPPYSSAKDPVNLAGMAAGNVVEGLVDVVHPEEFLDAPEDRFTLVDCRPSEMREATGAFDDSLHVPLPSLRDSLDTLTDAPEPVVTYCMKGQTSYMAARALAQRGVDVCNLDGGYALVRAMRRDRAAREETAVAATGR